MARAFVLVVLVSACGAGPTPPDFGPPVAAPPDNTQRPAVAALGEKLFFDARLSSNRAVSCATCHRRELAFSEGSAHSTLGVTSVALPRHVPALQNLAWRTTFFWDGGVKNLESLSFAPLTNPNEMGMNLFAIQSVLVEGYNDAFAALFDDGATVANATKALAQFLRTLVSNQSPFDRGALDATATRGQLVFNDACAACHPAPLFTDDGFHDVLAHDDDRGRGRVTNLAADEHAFKTPSLRNVALTAPFFHDGSSATLSDAVTRHSPLTAEQTDDVVAFLRALTDDAFVGGQ